MFVKFDNVIQSDLFTLKSSQLKTDSGWVFNGYSANEDSFTFWYKELINDDFYSKQLLDRINNLTNVEHKLNRVYANGQTYGLCGDLHTDDINENCYTFIIYMNCYWNVKWGGATVFYENEDNFVAVLPRPNVGLYFKSNILHVGLEPTRHCKDLRMTVALKLETI